jgi:hypothetical protein
MVIYRLLDPGFDPGFDPDDPLGPFGPLIRRYTPEIEDPEYEEDDEDDRWYPPSDLKAA